MHPAVQQVLCEAKVDLFETDWEPLIMAKPSESLLENLKLLYELEYKYSRLSILEPGAVTPSKQQPFFHGVPQTHENVVKRALNAVMPIGRKIADQLSQVYEKWLSAHALENPKLWGMERAEHAMDDPSKAYDHLAKEYIQRMGEAGRMFTSRRGPSDSDIVENLEKLPSLFDAVDELFSNEKDAWERGDPYDDDDDDDEGGGGTFPYSDAKEWLEETLNDHGDFGHLWHNYLKDSLEAEDILAEMYAEFVFPPWLSYWKSKGISETRDKILGGNEKLKKLSSAKDTAPKEFLGTLNQVIQLSHQTGPMMEYITAEHPDVDEDVLKSLTDSDTDEWDEELAERGVYDPRKQGGSSTGMPKPSKKGKRIKSPAWPVGKTEPVEMPAALESVHPAVRDVIMESLKGRRI